MAKIVLGCPRHHFGEQQTTDLGAISITTNFSLVDSYVVAAYPFHLRSDKHAGVERDSPGN